MLNKIIGYIEFINKPDSVCEIEKNIMDVAKKNNLEKVKFLYEYNFKYKNGNEDGSSLVLNKLSSGDSLIINRFHSINKSFSDAIIDICNLIDKGVKVFSHKEVFNSNYYDMDSAIFMHFKDPGQKLNMEHNFIISQ